MDATAAQSRFQVTAENVEATDITILNVKAWLFATTVLTIAPPLLAPRVGPGIAYAISLLLYFPLVQRLPRRRYAPVEGHRLASNLKETAYLLSGTVVAYALRPYVISALFYSLCVAR